METTYYEVGLPEVQPHALILYQDTVTILALNPTFHQPETKQDDKM